MSACNSNCNQGRACRCTPEPESMPNSSARGILNGLVMAVIMWAIVAACAWGLA